MTRFLLVVLIGCGAAGLAPAVGVIPLTPRLPQSAVASLVAATPADDLTDPAALAKRIADNVRTAGDKLRDRDAGTDTRKAQAAALKDIDKLLDQAENPPPMSCPMPMDGGGGSPPPMGGGGQPKPMPGQGNGQQPSPKPGGKSSGQRPSWREKGEPGDAPMGQKPMGGQPMPGKPDQGGKEPGPMPDPSKPMGDQPGPAGKQPGGAKPDGSPGKPDSKPGVPFDDAVTKQVWGHLPERLRQEVNQYYKEQFMPKYGDLLKQYYADLAEREKSGLRK